MTRNLAKAVLEGVITPDDAAKVAGLPAKVQNRAVRMVRASEAKTVSEAAFPLCERCRQVKVDGCTACGHLQECFATGKKPRREMVGEVKDDAGVTVPQRLVPVFRARVLVADAMKKLNACAEAFRKIEQESALRGVKPVGGHYTKYYPTFKEARKALAYLSASIVCGSCDGDGCGVCGDRGWLTKGEVLA